MQKISKNKKGFTLIDTLLVIVIVLVIAGVGYLVYKHDHKTIAPKTSVNSSASIYSGWKYYQNQYFSFKYPSNWHISQDLYEAAPYISLTSSVSTIKSYIKPDPIYPSSIDDLNLDLFYKPLDPSGCMSNAANRCTVQIVSPINIKNIIATSLVTYSDVTLPPCPRGSDAQCVTNNPDKFVVVNNPEARVGDANVSFRQTILNGKYDFTGCVLTGVINSNISNQECSSIKNYSEFQNSDDYKNLVNVLKSLSVTP